MTICKIKLNINMSGNSSKACAHNDIKEFTILKIFNIYIHYNKAPQIIEII
ncbi:hypothetical protein Lalb_Chr05g0230031 [Lupinus albus]|uniref:Uncharacterized protein n=1 Tax=Lupinus albus TaxID=3870 RepID=A0A6A4QNR2_LUPAL|nr:hypothetical protein Lalb_Chr05g0230031 [Lupinus albus]